VLQWALANSCPWNPSQCLREATRQQLVMNWIGEFMESNAAQPKIMGWLPRSEV
jgi:hypothetical protein